MTQTLTHNKAESASDLSYKPFQRRNISSRALSFLAALFAAIAVLPLILVLGYVLVQGGSKISLALLTQLPPPPGLEDGGIANAIVGTLVVTTIAALIAVPVGVGGGIFLAPVLHLVRWAPPRTIAALSSAYIATNSVAALAGKLMSLPAASLITDLWDFWPLLLSVALGSWLGHKLLLGIFSECWVKAVTSLLVLVVAFRLLTSHV